MQVTLDAHPIRDACRIPVIIQRVPVRAWQDYTGVSRLFDDAVHRCEKQKHSKIKASSLLQPVYRTLSHSPLSLLLLL
jgi:hypothetical protein